MVLHVIGTQRSGTNFVAELLQRHLAIKLVNEPFAMHSAYFRGKDLELWTREQDGALQIPTSDYAEHRRVNRLAEEIGRWFLAAPEGTHRGLKETVLYGKLRWLSSLTNETRFVHVVRDPRSIVASVLRVKDRDRLWTWNSASERAADLLNVPADIVHQTEVAAIAHVVKARWALFRQEVASSSAYTVRLEDLAFGGPDSLEAVSTFIGLEPSSAQYDFLLKSHEGSRGGLYSSFRARDRVLTAWKDDLPPSAVDEIQEILGNEMRELGYAAA